MKRLRDDESGAIAIFMAIVLTLLVIPLIAGAVSSMVRHSTVSEMQRSADVGALAGARVVPLSDLPVAPDPGSALTVACEQALAALDADDAMGEDYGGVATCDADYLPDPSVLGALDSCIGSIQAGTEVDIPDEITSLPGWGDVSAAYSNVVAQVEKRIDELFDLIRGTLPILTKPGVTVTLTRPIGQTGNDIQFEGAAPDEPPTTESATATARRRIKNLALFPVIYDSATGTYVVDTNEALPSESEVVAVIEALEDTIASDPVLGPVYADLGCTGLLDRLGEDVRDLYNPGAGNAPTQGEVLDEAMSQGAAVLGYAYDEAPDAPAVPDPVTTIAPSPSPCIGLAGVPCPSISPLPSPSSDPSVTGLLDVLLDTLRIPFLDFVPLCVNGTDPLQFDLSSCEAADGSMRATLVPDP
jgi:Flp pilus assembly pilin Flp